MDRDASSSILALAAALGLGGPAAAQVATDGTVGPRLELGGPDYAIGAELGRRAEGNLFHSFERFSIRSGESATFSGPLDVRNVISRVTGGARSNIDGRLAATIPGADFYFLNPAGVLFGPNASLDVQGSFHVSTADELRFADGAVFSARDPAASSLSVAAPEAFGFLGGTPRTIEVDRSTLELGQGETFSLVGGDVRIDGGNSGAQGTLRAEAGTVQLLALGPRGEARLSNGEVNADQGADVTVTDQALIDVSGNGGGMVRIRAGRLIVDGQSSIFADNHGTTDGRGGIDASAETVDVLAGSALTADALGAGDAGRVAVDAKQIRLETAGSFRSDTYDAGGGGSVVVNAERLELFSEGFIRSVALPDSTGPAGVVDLTAGRLNVDNGFIEVNSLSSAETADAGTVLVSADHFKLINEGRIFSGTDGAGDGGDIFVTAANLVADGTVDHENMFLTGILASANQGSTGDSGNITVRAQSVELTNGGSFAALTEASGDGGRVDVFADRVVISSGAFISADVRAGASGAGGEVRLRARDVALAGGGSISSITAGEGAGGDVSIRAREGLTLSDKGVISTEAFDEGAAGDVTIDAPSLRVSNSFIGASSGAGASETADAGDVMIDADFIHFVDDGRIFSGTNGAGDGGDIKITAGKIIADVGSDPTMFHTGIATTAEADSTGASGNITVHADQIRLINGGLIATSSAGAGDAGVVEIEVADLQLSSDSLESESVISSSTTGTGKGGIVDITAGDIFVDFGFIGANTFGTNEQADAGSVIINADRVHFVNEGRIFNGTNGAGDGGDVHVTANTIVADATVDHVNEFHTGIASTAEADSTGASGDVTVRSGEIRLINGGLIATSSQGSGNAGDVFVAAGEALVIRGRSADRPSSISVSSQNPSTRAAVGNLEIKAPVVEVSEGGRIEAANAGLGRSGGVSLEAQTLRLENGGSITAASGQVDAGDIVIQVEDLVDLRRSAITTSAAGGEGGGGNIRIDSRFVVLDSSEIVATARRGAGGNIDIVADNFIRSPDSVLDASSDLGLPGTVVVSSPELDLTGGLVTLDVPLLDAAALLRERCAARRDVGASSFTGVGRGGRPPSPDQPLMSDYRIGAAPPAAGHERPGISEGRRSGAASAGEPASPKPRDAAIALFAVPSAPGRLALAPLVLVQPCTGAL